MTAIARRHVKKIIVLFLFLVVGVGLFVVYRRSVARITTESVKYDIENEPLETPYIRIKDAIIPVEIVKSSEAVKKGLSGRKSLDANSGMLFLFSRPGRYRFWMPNMYFSIDIVWINENKVIDIDENVSNEFDPANPVFFTPISPVQYVLEVNAGFSKSHGIAIGDAVSFNNIE